MDAAATLSPTPVALTTDDVAFVGSLSVAELAQLNARRAECFLARLRPPASPVERDSLFGAVKAVVAGRNREYTPAVLSREGEVFSGSGHVEATIKARQAGHSVQRRGFLTTEGAFLGLMDIARRERGKADDAQVALRQPIASEDRVTPREAPLALAVEV